MGFSRQEYWNGLPFLSPGDLSNPGIKPGSPALQAGSLPSEPPGMWKRESGPVATDAPSQALLGAAVTVLCYVSCNLGTTVHRGKRAEKTHGKKQGLLKWETIWPTHTPNFLMAFWLLPFLVHNYASISPTSLEVKWGPPCSLKQDAKASSMWDYQLQIVQSHSTYYRVPWWKLLPSLLLKFLEN